MRLELPTTALISALVVGSFLGGCSSAAWKPVQRPVNYQTTLAPTSTQSVLLLRSTGAPMPVDYTISSKGKAVKPGKIFDNGDSQLAPWVARLTKSVNRGLAKTLTQREMLVDANTFYILTATSDWTTQDTYITRKGRCYPSATHFTPEPNKRYMALFTFSGSSCTNEVYDITSGAPVPLKI